MGNVGDSGPGRVNSWFDHEYPGYDAGGYNGRLRRWDEEKSSTFRRSVSWYDDHNEIDFSHSEGMPSYPFQTLQYINLATGVTISTPAAFTTVNIPAPPASDSGTGSFSAARASVLNLVGWFVGESVSLESSLGLNEVISAAALNSFAVPVTVTIEYADEEIQYLTEIQLAIFW